MSKTREQIEKDLDANIPRDVIEQREGGGSRKLSYLAGWYVIDRMNKIFGADGWSYDVTELRCVHQGKIPGKYGEVESASYVATVQLFAQFQGDSNAKRVTDVGFGNGTDKSDPGKPHELATKEAVTDAIKRCAKSLGMSLGLALYDKSGEFVDDTPKEAPSHTAPSELPKSREALKENNAERESLNKRITAMSKVVIAKRVKTLDELKAQMKADYGVSAAKDMNDEQAKDLLAKLEKMASG